MRRVPEMSLLFGARAASVHLRVVETASSMSHVKGVKENKCRWAFRNVGMRSRTGGISFISVCLALKGDIIREKQSPFHIYLRLSLPVLNPHLNHFLSGHL